jgi:hypothetical protein
MSSGPKATGQAELLQPVDGAQAGLGAQVGVAEHVVDAGGPGQQQLGALELGPDPGHLPGQVATGRSHQPLAPLEQGQVLAHAAEQRLRQVGVGVGQPGQDHPAVVADHLGVGEAGRHLGERPGGQDLAVGEGDRSVSKVPGRPHRQHIAAADDGGSVHQGPPLSSMGLYGGRRALRWQTTSLGSAAGQSCSDGN